MALDTPLVLKCTEHSHLENADSVPPGILNRLQGKLSETHYTDDEPNEYNLTKEKNSTPQNLRYLGMNTSGWLGYYIGVDWLCFPREQNEAPVQNDAPEIAEPEHDTPPSENAAVIDSVVPPEGVALLVTPKIEGIDWMTMFMECLQHPQIFNYIQDCYAISTDLPSIPLPKDEAVDVTPLLLVHYIAVLRRVVGAGLKRGYVTRQENLSSKIKGKLMLGKTISKNRCVGRDDRNYCRYQDYTVDCPENRILKRALERASQWLRVHKSALTDKTHDNGASMQESLGHCHAAFSEVSDDVDIRSTERLRINPLYRDYAEALKLARIILRRFHYSFRETSGDGGERKVPPFWIDMPKLFELYAYSKLYDKYGNTIRFQTHGNYGYPDFLKTDECMIIDAKYKRVYIDDEKYNKYNIDDIRQVSGYARDTKTRKKLNISPEGNEHPNPPMPRCLILHPPRFGEEEITHELSCKLTEGSKPLTDFTRMYTRSLSVPLKHPDNKK